MVSYGYSRKFLKQNPQSFESRKFPGISRKFLFHKKIPGNFLGYRQKDSRKFLGVQPFRKGFQEISWGFQEISWDTAISQKDSRNFMEMIYFIYVVSKIHDPTQKFFSLYIISLSKTSVPLRSTCIQASFSGFNGCFLLSSWRLKEFTGLT